MYLGKNIVNSIKSIKNTKTNVLYIKKQFASVEVLRWTVYLNICRVSDEILSGVILSWHNSKRKIYEFR